MTSYTKQIEERNEHLQKKLEETEEQLEEALDRLLTTEYFYGKLTWINGVVEDENRSPIEMYSGNEKDIVNEFAYLIEGNIKRLYSFKCEIYLILIDGYSMSKDTNMVFNCFYDLPSNKLIHLKIEEPYRNGVKKLKHTYDLYEKLNKYL